MSMNPNFPEREAQKWQEIERRLSALERSARLPLSSIGSGGLIVKDGGQVVIQDAQGDPQVVMDVDGVQVGTDVEMNALGLFVNGGVVSSTDIWLRTATVTDTPIGSSPPGSFSLSAEAYTVPSWASEVSVLVLVDGEIDEGTATSAAQNTRIFINSQASRIATFSDPDFFAFNRVFGHRFTGALPSSITARIDFEDPISLDGINRLWATLTVLILAQP